MIDPVTWMRTRPDSVKELMKRFPPAALIKAVEGRKLMCPSPGEVAVVGSYNEKGTIGAARITGMDENTGFYECSDIYQCQPEWLEVVGYQNGQDEAWVTFILE